LLASVVVWVWVVLGGGGGGGGGGLPNSTLDNWVFGLTQEIPHPHVDSPHCTDLMADFLLLAT